MGLWAEYVCGLPWTTARQHQALKSRELAILAAMQSRRELVLRNTKNWTAKKLDESIGRKRVNVQSAMMQIKGVVPLADCKHCAEGRGPWAKCIVIASQHGQENPFEACANCVWNVQQDRCSFSRTKRAREHSAEARSSQPSHHRRTSSGAISRRSDAIEEPEKQGDNSALVRRVSRLDDLVRTLRGRHTTLESRLADLSSTMRGQAMLERGSTLEILSRDVMEACSAEEETIVGIEEELNIHTRRT